MSESTLLPRSYHVKADSASFCPSLRFPRQWFISSERIPKLLFPAGICALGGDEPRNLRILRGFQTVRRSRAESCRKTPVPIVALMAFSSKASRLTTV